MFKSASFKQLTDRARYTMTVPVNESPCQVQLGQEGHWTSVFSFDFSHKALSRIYIVSGLAAASNGSAGIVAAIKEQMRKNGGTGVIVDLGSPRSISLEVQEDDARHKLLEPLLQVLPYQVASYLSSPAARQ